MTRPAKIALILFFAGTLFCLDGIVRTVNGLGLFERKYHAGDADQYYCDLDQRDEAGGCR